ncbi:MAG: hypothetical protein VX527_09400 [Planctomycetota bacterium]|nr:hypothetical protein [Planctomycetota bacterium]
MSKINHDKPNEDGLQETPENRALHGLLSLMSPGEPEAIDARVQRALDSIEQNESLASSRRRMVPTLVASLAGIAAMIILLVVIYPQTESLAQAQIEISQVVQKMQANDDRWYFIEVGRMEPGSGRGLVGELYVTGEGPFLAFTYHRGMPRRPGPIIGDDGDGIWILPPDGQQVPSKAIPKMLAEIMPRVAEGGLDPATLLQLAQDDWTLHRKIINVNGRQIIRIEAISPPMLLPTRFPPKPHGPNRMQGPNREQPKPPIGPPGSLNEHVERLLIDIDPETSEFIRLEVSRKIDGIEFPGAYMLFTRDDGQRPPPGLSPGHYELGPGGRPHNPFGGQMDGGHRRFPPGRSPLGPGPNQGFMNNPF